MPVPVAFGSRARLLPPPTSLTDFDQATNVPQGQCGRQQQQQRVITSSFSEDRQRQSVAALRSVSEVLLDQEGSQRFSL